MKRFIGIDISKKDFTVAIPLEEGYQKFTVKQYKNDVKGVAEFLKDMPADSHCILEATGTYSLVLTYALSEHKIALSVINPKTFKQFFIMMQATIKSDAQDAKLLSMYGVRFQPAVFRPKAKVLLLLQQKRVLIRQLLKASRSFKNIEESFKAAPFVEKDTLEMLHKILADLKQKIKEIQSKITKIAQQEFNTQYKLLTSIPAVGERLATAIILCTNAFKGFSSAKQLAKFVGVCPTYYQSGSSLNVKGKINRSGSPDLRALLYMCAVSSLRFNPVCQATYNRLKQNGKPSMVALTAVMHKLVRIIYGVIRNQKSFDPNWVSQKS